MSDQEQPQKNEHIALFSLPVVDAAMWEFLTERADHFRRRQITMGSVHYLILSKPGSARHYGTLQLRMINAQKTSLTAEATQDPSGRVSRLLDMLLTLFAYHLRQKQRHLEQITPSGQEPAQEDEAATLQFEIESALRGRLTTNEPPGPRASIDAWLDWRDAELQRGRPPHSVSLRRLAERSTHSESQLKHASAARKRTKN